MDPDGSDHDDRDLVGGLARRACDQCRLRKIRCDKRSPCSNCRSANVACRSTGEGQKSHEPRRRVLISSQYEKKIDAIDERLGGIEKALKELVIASRLQASTPSRSFGSSQASPMFPGGGMPFTASQDNTMKSSRYTPEKPPEKPLEQLDPIYEYGDPSSLASHSAYAQEFLESAVSRSTPEVLSSPRMNDALSSLRQMVEIQNRRREIDPQVVQFPNHGTGSRRRDVRDLELPPLPLVLYVLRKVKEKPTTLFGGYLPFLTVDRFIEKCREVFFCTEDYSDACFIITNYGLFGIFMELGFYEADLNTREDYNRYAKMCKDNLEVALANLNILMSATMESIVALIVGALHGIDISKPSLAWTLASTAIHMCQTLGYHRLASMETDPIETQRNKQILFWSAYATLNLMSLRLGRACVIQEYDISLPPPSESFSHLGVWGNLYAIWTRQAMVQNKIYTLLYSPAALGQPESDRVAHARGLVDDMTKNVIEPFERLISSNLDMSEGDMIYLRADRVMRLSIMTLIYRAIPAAANSGSPSTFTNECVETARNALEDHQACINDLKETSELIRCSYMHSAILVSPFVPFIVIFCHVIATSDTKDLILLQEFVASLRPLCVFSQSVDRLHNICSVLGTVAGLYVETKSRGKASEDKDLVSVGQEFDAYLSALGFAPSNVMTSNPAYVQADVPLLQITPVPSDNSFQGHEMSFPAPQPQSHVQDSMSIAEMSQATQLGNWFSGNQYMMGLMEEDMFQLNPNPD